MTPVSRLVCTLDREADAVRTDPPHIGALDGGTSCQRPQDVGDRPVGVEAADDVEAVSIGVTDFGLIAQAVHTWWRAGSERSTVDPRNNTASPHTRVSLQGGDARRRPRTLGSIVSRSGRGRRRPAVGWWAFGVLSERLRLRWHVS